MVSIDVPPLERAHERHTPGVAQVNGHLGGPGRLAQAKR
jgi:hypothetical protein